MYLPSGLTFLHFLQLPFSLLTSERPTAHSVVPNEQFKHRQDVNNLASISPYHDAPAVPGVFPDLPDDCTVDQVILLHRHGSRGPAMEQKYILKLVDTLDKARDVIQAAELPPDLKFLKDGYEYELVPQNLTIVGRKELFDHGVQFALKYPTFSTDVVLSTEVGRVMDSAYFFGQGFFGREVEDVTFLTTDGFSWLNPWKFCPKMPYVESFQVAKRWVDKYVPPIVERLSDLIPGVGFTLDDVRGALYACPYDLAARNKSPWCNVFRPRELRGLEYELDLSLDFITGRDASTDPGPLLGAFYIKTLIERLTDATGHAEPLYLEFAHDFTILLALSTMGLNKDAIPLNPVHPSPHRKFRSSHQTPFAANMVWEKFTCQKSFKGPQVRLVLNGATFPLSICAKSEIDEKYGTCLLTEFVRANEYSMDVGYLDAAWNTTCGTGH